MYYTVRCFCFFFLIVNEYLHYRHRYPPKRNVNDYYCSIKTYKKTSAVKRVQCTHRVRLCVLRCVRCTVYYAYNMKYTLCV